MVLTFHSGQQWRLAKNRFVLLGLVGLWGALATREALAEPFACTLAGGKGAVATRAEEVMELPRNEADCSGVKVAKGAMVACVTTQFDTLKCEKFSVGQTIASSAFGPKTSVQGWRASLVALLGVGQAR